MLKRKSKNKRDNATNETQGAITFSNGSKYEGNLKNGIIAHGEGTLTLADGREITGEFLEGKPHGYCTLTFTDGRKYTGGYIRGKRHGWGKMIFPEGKIFEGEWKNDLPHGEGSITHPDGTVEKGTWVRGKKLEHKEASALNKGYLFPLLIALALLIYILI